MLNTNNNIKIGDKITLYDREKALIIGEQYIKSYMKSPELLKTLDDNDKLQFLPKRVFGKTYEVKDIEIVNYSDGTVDNGENATSSDIVYIIKDVLGCVWHVSEIFVNK